MSSLSLYRLNDCSISEPKPTGTIFTKSARLTEIQLKGGIPARLFHGRGRRQVPEWAKYLSQIAAEKLPVAQRAAESAVLLIHTGGDYLYAATWGLGHLLIRPEVVHPDLGLRCALNLLAEETKGEDWVADRLRSVRTKRFSKATLTSQIQASRKGSFDDFPVDSRADQLRQVTAAPTDVTTWGQSITGGTSLHVRRPADPTAVIDVCKKIDAVHASTTYKKRYGWVDNISAVRDQEKIHRALEIAFLRIVSGEEGVDLTPPTIIEWKDVAGFELRLRRAVMEFGDPSSDILAEAVHRLSTATDFLGDAWDMKLAVVDHDGNDWYVWPLWKCIVAEVDIDGQTYIIDEGALFAVDNGFLYTLNTFVNSIAPLKRAFPATTPKEREAAYLARLCGQWNDALLLDRKLVKRSGATSIEICDVALAGGTLIHAKRGKGSAELSHLFSQGSVSAELLHMDSDFRDESKITISAEAGSRLQQFSWIFGSPFEPSKHTVAFAIMMGKRTPMKSSDLPFFSKINLRQRCDDLRRMGFKYAVDLVPLI